LIGAALGACATTTLKPMAYQGMSLSTSHSMPSLPAITPAMPMGDIFFRMGRSASTLILDATPWVVRMMPTGNAEHPWQLQTQCESLLLPTAAFMDEAGHILIEGKLTQTICTGATPNQFSEIERLSIALLHDHDIELFSGLTSLGNTACALEGSWRWHDSDLRLEPITTAEVESRFQFQTRPQP
jgi:hypothetical protein